MVHSEESNRAVLIYRPAGRLEYEIHYFKNYDIAEESLQSWLHNWSGDGFVYGLLKEKPREGILTLDACKMEVEISRGNVNVYDLFNGGELRVQINGLEHLRDLGLPGFPKGVLEIIKPERALWWKEDSKTAAVISLVLNTVRLNC